MAKFYLDKSGESQPPAGCKIVETEASLLTCVFAEGSLLVRGRDLCRWAETICHVRQWPVEELVSPVNELIDCCPALGHPDALTILKQHGRIIGDLPRPWRLDRVLEGLFPEAHNLWRGAPSLNHAAQWLLWLDETSVPAYLQPLLANMAVGWKTTAKIPEADIYTVSTANAAREFLSRWLAFSTVETTVELPAFPLDVPEHLIASASREWMPRIVQSHGGFFYELQKMRVPRCVQERVGDLTYRYYRENPKDVTREAIQALDEYLSRAQVQDLRKIVPPPTPSSIPANTSDIMEWFDREYLPYREWNLDASNQDAEQKVAALAGAFANWYLGYYPVAISSGASDLAFFKAGKLRSDQSHDVTLLIILDGLNQLDSKFLLRNIVANQPRLVAVQHTLCFAALPTVTQFCKPALINGGTPVYALERAALLPSNVKVLPENKDPCEALRQGNAGDCFIWILADPDVTYHTKADLKTIRQRVDGALKVCGERIRSAILSIPAHLHLRTIVTTDHGRLIGCSTRELPVPEGMESHQRAAWGPWGKSFPPSGVVVDDNHTVAFLNGPRFGLPQHCAIVLSQASFLMQDGKRGEEAFPHGGLYPEEIIIPWIEIVRDRETPSVICKVKGKGREGQEGEIVIEFINPSEIEIRVIRVDFRISTGPTQSVRLDHVLPRLSTKSFRGSLTQWPKRTDLARITCAARLRLPVGDEFDVKADLALECEGFYFRDNILEGLT